MDPKLIRETTRMIMLQYGLERLPDKDGPFNLTIRDLTLWKLVRSQISHLSFERMLEAIEADHCFTKMTYNQPVTMDRRESHGGVRFDSANAHPRKYLANRKHYQEHLQEWGDRPRPAIAAFKGPNSSELQVPLMLTPAEDEVHLVNEGFGGDAAIEVHELTAPAWLHVERTGHCLTLRAQPREPGVYDGYLTAQTSGGRAELPVRVERLDFTEPGADEVSLDSLLPPAEGRDPEATRDRLLAYLSDLGYDLLPGNLAVRAVERKTYPDRMRIRLEPDYIRRGELPFPHRLPEKPRLYDEGGDLWPDTIHYRDGFLSGLEDLFDDYEATAGQHLVLRPAPNGFRFSFEEPDPLEEARGYRYWLTGSAAALNELTGWHELLRGWLHEGEVNVITRDWEENPFTQAVTQLHAAGTLTVKTSTMPLEPLVYIEGESLTVVNLRTRKLVQGAKDVRFLWRQGELLDGIDVRERAQGSSDGLTLGLTPEQRKLAASLRPTPYPHGNSEMLLTEHGLVRGRGPHDATLYGECWFRDAELYTRLRRFRTAFMKATGWRQGNIRIVRAAELLNEFGLTPTQVNIWREGLLVTEQGWLGPDPRQLSLSDLAAAIVQLLDEPAHHSQLRQIAEAYLGEPIDPTAFLGASLRGCGWAGRGYRRARLPGDPEGTNLKNVVRSLLSKRFLRKADFMRAAHRFLRTPPEKIAEAYEAVLHEYWQQSPP